MPPAPCRASVRAADGVRLSMEWLTRQRGYSSRRGDAEGTRRGLRPLRAEGDGQNASEWEEHAAWAVPGASGGCLSRLGQATSS